jgi:hypothetical protein
MSDTIREQLHRQIDRLPDEVVAQIADFAFYIAVKNRLGSSYAEWEGGHWQAFALEHLFDEQEEVTYSLEDAQEVYRR